MADVYIDLTPKFEAATRICILATRFGGDDARRTAEQELLRYARELDRLSEFHKTQPSSEGPTNAD